MLAVASRLCICYPMPPANAKEAVGVVDFMFGVQLSHPYNRIEMHMAL